MMKGQDRHAYLIITHGNPYVLEKLILLLDDERNDIYIHVDKKTKGFDFENIQNLVRYSQLVFIDRRRVYWGHVSQIQVELDLFKIAYNSNKGYTYYHLISGGDLPIKSQDHIHGFFARNKGREFVGFSNDEFQKERVSQLHFFSKHLRLDQDAKFGRFLRWLGKRLASLQKKVNYDHAAAENKVFVYGANWVSITSNLVGELLRSEKWILDFYKYSYCGDEVFIQTFIYNSHFKNRVYDMDDELKSCMRFMDWKRGRPFTFRKDDFDTIMNSEMLFARKFDEAVDKDIIDAIFDSVKHQPSFFPDSEEGL